MPALLVLLDRPSLRLERALSGNLALRSGINKTSTLAPIMEEPEPVEDAAQLPTVLQNICNTPGRCPKPFLCDIRMPFSSSSLNTQMTPMVEFTSLSLGERQQHIREPSGYAKAISSEITPPNGNEMAAVGPRCGLLAPDEFSGRGDISIRTRRGVSKRARDPESDEERQDAKRPRTVPNVVPCFVRTRRRDTPLNPHRDIPAYRNMDVDAIRVHAPLPKRPIFPSEQIPRPINFRKRSFRDIEHNVAELAEDVSRYAKRRARKQ
ncbi:hypothetical protein B0H11DRAFT_203195 [Mycena galericulata]|nr:hypothetical protein B0H11DRAFT_203195 [Mycena galericulata]